MKARRYQIQLTGETPLLMHQDNLQWSDNIKKWQNAPENKKKSVAGDDRSPAWTWMGGLYVDNGFIAIPSDNLMTMFREGGTKCPTGKGKATFKAQTQSGIVVDQSGWPVEIYGHTVRWDDLSCLIENENFEEHMELCQAAGFELFVKRAKIGDNKHVRVRPRFNSWKVSGSITVLDDMITTDALQNIVQTAGFYCGLCDWRPSSPKKPGQFGKFSAEIKQI